MITSPQTLSEFLRTVYLPTRLGMEAGSAEQLAVAVRTFDRWHGSPVTLGELSTHLLTAFLHAYSTGHSPVTVNSKRRALLTLWRAAAKQGLSATVSEVPRAKEPRRMPEAWSKDQVARLVVYCRQLPGMVGEVPRRYWWASLVTTVWYTGCRIGALLQTRSVDCDLGEGHLIVRAEASKTDIDRLYWLADQAVASIASHYCPHRELVWPWPYCRRWFGTCARNIIEAAGLPSTKGRLDVFHKLRRSNLSYTAAYGGLDMARQQADHYSSRTTLQHYIDPRILRQRSAADVLPRLNLDE